MDIADFIRARLDEDEADARATVWDGSGNRLRWEEVASATLDVGGDEINLGDRTIKNHVERHDPERVLAEVASKRLIVAEAFQHAATIDGEWGCCHDAEQIEAGLCHEPLPELLRFLALPYADHRDYRPEWAPGVED